MEIGVFRVWKELVENRPRLLKGSLFLIETARLSATVSPSGLSRNAVMNSLSASSASPTFHNDPEIVSRLIIMRKDPDRLLKIGHGLLVHAISI